MARKKAQTEAAPEPQGFVKGQLPVPPNTSWDEWMEAEVESPEEPEVETPDPEKIDEEPE